MRNPIYLFCIILISGCSGVKVTSDYNKSIDFTQFKSYSFYGWTEESDQLINQFDKERIEKAFAGEFAKRNLEYKEKDGDLIVSLFLVVDKKTSKTAYTNHYGTGGIGYYDYDYGYDTSWGVGGSTTTFQEREYEVGTLVCDAFSSESKKLVWQGIGSGTIEGNPQKNETEIPKAVAAIMADFPVNP